MSRLRILHVLDFLGNGGIEKLLSTIYQRFDVSVCSFDLVYHNIPAGTDVDKIAKICDVQEKAPSFYVINFISYRKWWKDFFDRFGCYNVIHIHAFFDFFFFVKDIIKEYNPDIKIVFHAHSTRHKKYSLYSMWRAFLSFPIKWYGDYFFCCSLHAAIDQFGKKIAYSNKCSLLKCGIETENFKFNSDIRSNIRKEMNSQEKVIICNIARFSTQKNHDFLIDLFHHFHTKISYSELWLIGDGELLDKIKMKTEKMNLCECIRFIGITDFPEKYLMGADVFILPSLYEGLGIVLIEAQTCGLPCIVSTAIQPEADMQCGLLKRIDLSDSFDKWCKVIKDSIGDIRRDCSEQVRKNGYDINDISASLQLFYCTLVKSRKELVRYTNNVR